MARKHHNDRDSHAGPSQRALRVGELIRHALAEMLTRGDVHDPVLQRMKRCIDERVRILRLTDRDRRRVPLGHDRALAKLPKSGAR